MKQNNDDNKEVTPEQKEQYSELNDSINNAINKINECLKLITVHKD